MKQHFLVTYDSGWTDLQIIESDFPANHIIDQLFSECGDIVEVKAIRLDRIVESSYP